MRSVLKRYQKRLTNLSSQNKALLLSRLSIEQFTDLHDSDFLLSKPSFEVIEQLLRRKPYVPLCDQHDARYAKVNELGRRLGRLARTARFIEEERGTHDLYVGYPFVRGRFADGTPVHGPLLFFPVRLLVYQAQWCLQSRLEEDISLNRSFALAYAHFQQTPLSDEALELNASEWSGEARVFLTRLYEWLKASPVQLNFNQALFDQHLMPFEALGPRELQEAELPGQLKLYPEAVVGIFPQSGSYLVPDYVQMLAADTPYLPLLSPPPLPTSTPQKLHEEDLLTPFALDASQEKVIRAVKQGQSVVVQGPPGSGKSQLIANLMADFAANGKRVLLVCQKKAALDVVYQRLTDTGMGAFTALIHDFRTDRPALYRQLADQIEQVEAYQAQNNSLDALLLDRQFRQVSRRVDQLVGQLDEFRAALFDESVCGRSCKELYLTSEPSRPGPLLGELYRQFRWDQPTDFEARLRLYARYLALFPPTHPWYQRHSMADTTQEDLRNLLNTLLQWPNRWAAIQHTYAELSGGGLCSGEMMEKLPILGAAYDSVQNYLLTFSNPERLLRYGQLPDTAAASLAAAQHFFEQHAEAMPWEVSPEALAALQVKLERSLEALQQWVGAVRWRLFSPDYALIKATAEAHGLRADREGLQTLLHRLQLRIEWEQLLHQTDGFDERDLATTLPRREAQAQWLHTSIEAARVVQALRSQPNWGALWQGGLSRSQSSADFLAWVGTLAEWQQTALHDYPTLQRSLTPTQLHLLFHQPHDNALAETLRRDADAMAEQDRLWRDMKAHEQAAVLLLREFWEERTETLPAEVLPALFDNQLRLAWIEHIERLFPILKTASTLSLTHSETELQEAVIEKQRLTRTRLLLNLREQTYSAWEVNRLGNRLTYRELHHQVTKKRKLWPIRKLLGQYTDEVFRLVPCWMASPEATSALFPMDAGFFDLVIYDEASQCFAESALPAAYRAKQVVVTGDSQQLPPNDLYRVRFDDPDEDESHPAHEIDALLDLALQHLPAYALSGHYRSKSLELIQFSNTHFYKNTLQLLPDFTSLAQPSPAIRYWEVPGCWEQNCNRIEAEAVVALVAAHLHEQPRASVGIVTFNSTQQQLIQDELEKAGLGNESLFVKNIENVQGDERDLIVFSVGYAPDKQGVMRMNFGSLNRAGGENRLNVAITRARERVVVVTSIRPHQLTTELAEYAGPRLLKAYLQYAWEVSEGRFVPSPRLPNAYRPDWLLKEKLLRHYPNASMTLPFADLTLHAPDARYEGLVLTDDDTYYESDSAKQPHAYLPLLLRQRGWPFRRLYSRQYWLDKRSE